MSRSRNSLLVRLANDKVLAISGYTQSLGVTGRECELYDPATGTWQLTGSMINGRTLNAAAKLMSNGKVYVYGGSSAANPISDEIYDPVTETWSAVSGARTLMSGGLANLPDGTLLIFGGTDGNTWYSWATIYNPQTGTFSAAGSMNAARSSMAVVTLGDGRVLVAGGQNASGYASTTAEIFDPVTRTWSVVAPPPHPALLARMLVLPNSEVIYLGDTNVIDQYIPATNTWVPWATLNGVHSRGGLAWLGDSAYVLGGYDAQGNLTASVERIFLETGTVTTSGPLLSPQSVDSWALLGPDYTSILITWNATAQKYSVCNPTTCEALGATCGTPSNGCGGTLSCGTCGFGTNCQAGSCQACVPKTCAELGSQCGTPSDQCGGFATCGVCGYSNACVSGTCGGASQAAVRDTNLSVPRCSTLGSSCGASYTGRSFLGPETGNPNTIRNSCTDGSSGTFHVDQSIDNLTIFAVSPNTWLQRGTTARVYALVWGSSSLWQNDRFDLYLSTNPTAATPTWTLVTTVGATRAGSQTLIANVTLPLSGSGSTMAIRGVYRNSGWPASPCGSGPTSDYDDLVFEVAPARDFVAPTVAFTSPASNAVVRDAALVTLTASDAVSLTGVTVRDGTSVVAVLTAPPFEFTWNTANAAEGNHTLTAIAGDREGNTATASLPLFVSNAPSVGIVAPAAQSTVTGTLALDLNISTVGSLTLVELLVDGVVVASSPTASLSWNSRTVSNGAHTLVVRATDSASRIGAASRAITTANDFENPQVVITPPSGTLRGVVEVQGTASDDTALASIELRIDGTLAFTGTTSPWSSSWDTTAVSDGAHTLEAKATDAAGNLGTNTLAVTVDNAPRVTISSPLEAATVSGTITFAADVSSPRSVTAVEYAVDGVVVSATWNSRTVANGSHQLRVTATDSAGSMGSSLASFTTANDFTAPELAITAPLAGAVRGVVLVQGEASDVSGLSSIELRIDGASVFTTSSSPWSFGWNSTVLSDGPHVLEARALDPFGNERVVTTSVVADNAPRVTFTAPTGATALSGLLALEVSTDVATPRTVMAVEFLADGFSLGTDTSEPFALAWNSRSVLNGSHTLAAHVLDSSGQLGVVELGVVTANDFVSPSVTIGAPAHASFVRGTVTVSGTATDDVALQGIDVSIDGFLLAAFGTSPWNTAWNTALVSDGAHVVSARAVDASGNQSTTSVSVTVDNTLPAVAISSPAAGPLGAGIITLTANASDPTSGIARVDFYRGATFIASATSTPFSVSWNATGLSGAQALTAVAFDAAGNSTTSAAVNVTLVTAQTAVYSSTFKAPRCSTLSTSCSTGTLVNGRASLGPESNQPNTLNASSCADGTAGTFHGTGESIDAVVVRNASGSPLVPGVTATVDVTVWAVDSTDRVDIWVAANASSPSWTRIATLTPPALNASRVVSATYTVPSGATQAVRASLRRGGSQVICPSGSRNDRDDVVFNTQ